VLTVVTWKWATPGYRSTFTAETVNVMRAMVARHYASPHRFVCLTDDATGLDAGIEPVPLWPDYRYVESPHGGGNPACYGRLKAFAPEMRAVLGDRFVSIDLDAVIVGDLAPLWDRPEPLVIWHHHLPRPGRNGPKSKYNGSMWLVATGAHPEVWSRFSDAGKGREAYAAGYHASDQGWIQYVLGDGVPGWTAADGVYSFRYDVLERHAGRLPRNARVVFFHGLPDPWTVRARHPWIAEHWR
jgi:hypothetical protein